MKLSVKKASFRLDTLRFGEHTSSLKWLGRVCLYVKRFSQVENKREVGGYPQDHLFSALAKTPEVKLSPCM